MKTTYRNHTINIRQASDEEVRSQNENYAPLKNWQMLVNIDIDGKFTEGDRDYMLVVTSMDDAIAAGKHHINEQIKRKTPAL